MLRVMFIVNGKYPVTSYDLEEPVVMFGMSLVGIDSSGFVEFVVLPCDDVVVGVCVVAGVESLVVIIVLSPSATSFSAFWSACFSAGVKSPLNGLSLLVPLEVAVGSELGTSSSGIDVVAVSPLIVVLMPVCLAYAVAKSLK